MAGGLEALGMAVLGAAQATQATVAAYHQGGFVAAGVVAARSVIKTRREIDQRFPNGHC